MKQLSTHENYFNFQATKKKIKLISPKPIEEQNLLVEPSNYFPIMTTDDFTICPSLSELKKMGEIELSQLKNFTIESKDVKIEFLENVDITYQNLD